MRQIACLCALALAVAGCERTDGYKFERKEFDRSGPNITIVTHPSLADLRAKAPPSAQTDPNRKLMAWSIIRPTGCEMHIVDPSVSYQPEWIGHEAAHCVWGRWHS